MKKTVVQWLAPALLLSNAWLANAANELVVHVVKDGRSDLGLTVKIDGDKQKSINRNGLVFFDLSAGAHSIQLLQGDSSLHSVRFDSAGGQFVDINIALADSVEPQVSIENYFNTEAVSSKNKAAKGWLSGRVTSNGIPLTGATVSVAGTNIEEETDVSGAYKIELPRGVYQIKINHPDFGSKDVSNYRVISNVEKNSNFTIRSGGQPIEEVVVLAKVDSSAFQESERYSTGVIETMGIEQLARFGDSDVAASVIRVPSVTVQDSKFVFIRGLGGRYITTTLNGSTMPSTNPTRRTVPLDLFPSNIVEQLDVKKTFVASMPGESTGGNLVINTRTFPDEAAGKISVNIGYGEGITGDEAYVDSQDGNFDVIGWDDGERSKPAIVAAIAEALQYSDYYPAAVEQQLGQLAALELKDNFDLETKNAGPDMSLGINYGDLFYLDGIDAELGYFAAANYKNSWDKKSAGVSRSYGGLNASVVKDDYEFEEFTHNIEANGLLSLGFNVGNSTYQANTIVSRVTEENIKYSEGLDGDQLEQSVRYSIDWIERQFLSQQFTGQHYFGEDDQWNVDWQLTGSQATRYAPDRREVRFNLSDGDGVYNLEVPNLLRQYDDLTDDNVDFSANVDYLIMAGDFESTLTVGGQAISRERESESISYGFKGGLLSVDDNAPTLSVSDVINADTITGNTSTGYTFQDKTLPSDSYDAEMDLNSLFASYDLLWNYAYQFVLGVRYEDYQQTTETFSLQGAQQAVESLIDEDVVLPSFSFNWYYAEDEQLRFAVSKTVSRPDFKETSNAAFYDTEFNFRVRGNPDLNVSEVINVDLRWEKYWDDQQSLSLALFYKDLKDPIERVVQAASGTAGNSRTFQNAESAEIFGVELDVRKDFAFNEGLTKTSFIAVNASWIDSEVTLQNSNSRKLQGQPDYTFNLIVGYDDIESGQELTLLFNQNGETIVDVGVSGQPDILEEPRLDINVNYKYQYSETLTFKAKIKNLLNTEVEFTQGGNVFQQYEKGAEFQAGFDWTF
jgi:outer membrane receptor protein involved in Fe transport